MKKLTYLVFILLSLVGLFFPESLLAKENKLRVLCNSLPVSLKEKKNFATFPRSDNQQIYEINFDSKNKVSEVRIFDKFASGSIYDDREYTAKNFEDSIENILYRKKINPQKFTQVGNKLIMRPSIPVVFPGSSKRMLLNDGTHTLDLNTLELKKTLMFNDDWVKKANCKKVGNEEPPTYAYNLSVMSQRAARLRGKVPQDTWQDIFRKYITLLNISINAFDEWEEEIYPNEVPFYSSRFLSLALLAFDKSYMNLAGGIENPFFNIDEAYEYANKAVEMLNSPKLQKKYAGIFLQRADYGFTKRMLGEDKNVAVLNQNLADIERYFKNPDGDIGKAYYLKGASQLFINTKSSVKEACKNLTKAMELNYKFMESFKKAACKES